MGGYFRCEICGSKDAFAFAVEEEDCETESSTLPDSMEDTDIVFLCMKCYMENYVDKDVQHVTI
jgi:hypothetical protein